MFARQVGLNNFLQVVNVAEAPPFRTVFVYEGLQSAVDSEKKRKKKGIRAPIQQPSLGVEPRTNSLQDRRSPAELQGHATLPLDFTTVA